MLRNAARGNANIDIVAPEDGYIILLTSVNGSPIDSNVLVEEYSNYIDFQSEIDFCIRFEFYRTHLPVITPFPENSGEITRRADNSYVIIPYFRPNFNPLYDFVCVFFMKFI